jgi:hypothetical protein
VGLIVFRETIQVALPELLKQLPAVRRDADRNDRTDEPV